MPEDSPGTCCIPQQNQPQLQSACAGSGWDGVNFLRSIHHNSHKQALVSLCTEDKIRPTDFPTCKKLQGVEGSSKTLCLSCIILVFEML